MTFITYKQADPRWGKKNYNGSSTMAAAGCGPTSCAILIYAYDGKTTPIDTMKYMQTHGDKDHKSFAIYGNGTAWNGITQCLKDFGMENVKRLGVAETMESAWKALRAGALAIFRMSAGSRGGITWTTAGHYISVTDYKVVDGKHYVYTRDPGGRNHDGWFCYETQMRGLIPDVWTCRIPGGQPYTGAFPKLPDGSTVADFAKAQKGTYAYRGSSKPHKKFHNKFTEYFAGRYGIDEKGQFPKYKNDIAGDCDLFAFGYCLSKTGNGQEAIMDAMGKTYWWWSANLYRYLKSQGKVSKTPQVGAIAFYSKGTTCTHICLVVGVDGNYVITIDKNGKYVKQYKRKKSLYLGYYVPKFKTQLQKGMEGSEVLNLQKALQWYGVYPHKPDGKFGDLTKSAVMTFQDSEGLVVDGLFGAKSLAKLKEARR